MRFFTVMITQKDNQNSFIESVDKNGITDFASNYVCRKIEYRIDIPITMNNVKYV